MDVISLFLLSAVSCCFGLDNPNLETEFQSKTCKKTECRRRRSTSDENSKEHWEKLAKEQLKKRIFTNINIERGTIDNLYLIIGHGIPLAPVRGEEGIYEQLKSRSYHFKDRDYFNYEQFLYTGLLTSECNDDSLPDSSCLATSLLNGVKSSYGTIGLTSHIKHKKCYDVQHYHRVKSLFKKAQEENKLTGIITTRSLTGPYAAATYAHSASRYWNYDGDIRDDGYSLSRCEDIASQMISSDISRKMTILFGGGSVYFTPTLSWRSGLRRDKRDLLAEYNYIGDSVVMRERSHIYNVLNDKIKYSHPYKHNLGVFADRDFIGWRAREPTLVEMLEFAFDVFGTRDRYVLVEGGTGERGWDNQVDQLDKAISYIVRRSNINNTLILLVTDNFREILNRSTFRSRSAALETTYVAIYGRGPWAHTIPGIADQVFPHHLINVARDTDFNTFCAHHMTKHKKRKPPTDSQKNVSATLLTVFCAIFIILKNF